MNEALKIIKRINQRLAEYEKRGLTDSRYYKKIVTKMKMSGLDTTHSKTGELRLSRSKNALEKAITEFGSEALQRIESLPSLKQEVAKEKARAKTNKERATTREIYERINKQGKLERWLEENLTPLYADAQAGMKEAETLYKATKEGLRPKTYDYIFSLIERYEKAKAKMESIFQKSNFNKGVF